MLNALIRARTGEGGLEKAMLGTAISMGTQLVGGFTKAIAQKKKERELHEQAKRGPIMPEQVDNDPYMKTGGNVRKGKQNGGPVNPPEMLYQKPLSNPPQDIYDTGDGWKNTYMHEKQSMLNKLPGIQESRNVKGTDSNQSFYKNIFSKYKDQGTLEPKSGRTKYAEGGPLTGARMPHLKSPEKKNSLMTILGSVLGAGSTLVEGMEGKTQNDVATSPLSEENMSLLSKMPVGMPWRQMGGGLETGGQPQNISTGAPAMSDPNMGMPSSMQETGSVTPPSQDQPVGKSMLELTGGQGGDPQQTYQQIMQVYNADPNGEQYVNLINSAVESGKISDDEASLLNSHMSKAAAGEEEMSEELMAIIQKLGA